MESHSQISVVDLSAIATAVATIFIAAFTIVLAVVTRRQANLTKQAIKISERALTELEAPFVTVKILKNGIEWSSDKNLKLGVLQFCFANHGRTPAHILEFFEDLREVDFDKGLPPPISGERGPPMPYGVVAPPGGVSEAYDHIIFPKQIFTDETGFRTKNLFLIGYVKYKTIFDTYYTLGFCFLFNERGGEWLTAGDEQYSYCRKEQTPYTLPGTKRQLAASESPPHYARGARRFNLAKRALDALKKRGY